MTQTARPVTRDRYLTRQWNNRLVVGLGAPMLAFVAIAFTSLTDKAAFIGMVIFGAVY